MKTIAATAIVALVTSAIGLSAIAPTYAQQSAPMPQHERVEGKRPGHNVRFEQQGPRMAGLEMIGFERGAEALEIALVRLSYAIDMTAEQQPLFDTLKTDALAAAETFATAVEGLRPAAPAEGETMMRPDISERFANRIAIETAHLAALEAVQPAFTAFFDSLTDEQKAALMPQRPDRQGGPGMGSKGGMNHEGMAPGDDMPASAPQAPTNG